MKIHAATLNCAFSAASPFEYYDAELHLLYDAVKAAFSDSEMIDMYSKATRLGKFLKIRPSPLVVNNIGVLNEKELALAIRRSTASVHESEWKQIEKKYPNMPRETFVNDLIALDLKFQQIMEQVALKHPRFWREKVLPKYNVPDVSNLTCFIWPLLRTANNRLVDILFLQEVSITNESILREYMSDNYWFSDNVNGSMILIYRRFLEEYSTHMPENIHGNDWARNINDETVYVQFSDLILISSHLTSKRKSERAWKNCEDQFQVFKTVVDDIVAANPEKRVIYGIDANFDISSVQCVDNKGNFKPTVRKMRSVAQFQYTKIEKLDLSCKDFICSNLLKEEYNVHGNDNETIPSASYPFDHFMVSAILNSENNIKTVK